MVAGKAGVVSLVVMLAAVGSAGCMTADEAPGPGAGAACLGARTRFFAQAPGFHHRVAVLGADHPMLTVTARPAEHHGFAGLVAEGLQLPPAWSDGLLGSVSWTVA